MKVLLLVLFLCSCMPSAKMQMSLQERQARVKKVKEDRMVAVAFVGALLIVCWIISEKDHRP